MMVLMALATTLMATPVLALVSPIYHRGMTTPADVDEEKGRLSSPPSPGEKTSG